MNTTDPDTPAPLCGQSTPSADNLRTDDRIKTAFHGDIPAPETVPWSVYEAAIRATTARWRGHYDKKVAELTEARAEITAMREAMNAAAAKLCYIINEADALWDIRDESRAALAKLQPFLDR